MRVQIQHIRSMRIRNRILGLTEDCKILLSKNFFLPTLEKLFSLGICEGRPSYRRSNQPSKKNTQNFKTSSLFFFFICGSFFVHLWIRIQPGRVAIMIHADPDPKHWYVDCKIPILTSLTFDQDHKRESKNWPIIANSQLSPLPPFLSPVLEFLNNLWELGTG